MKKGLFWSVNLLLLFAMVFHVAFSWYSLAQNPYENSAPAWVSLFNAFYYLISLGLLHLGRFLYHRRAGSKNA